MNANSADKAFAQGVVNAVSDETFRAFRKDGAEAVRAYFKSGVPSDARIAAIVMVARSVA